MLPCRPHYLFDQVAADDRMVSIPIPLRQVGTPNLLETFLLMAIGKIVKAKRIFEIGTFAGQTTRHLAANFPNAEILTLDLDATRSGLPRQGQGQLQNVRGDQITALQGHSMQFDFSPWYESCEMVFIDGGHDYETVKADTETAFKLVNAPRLKCAIVWHDYENPRFPGLTKYLQERPEAILHVLDSQIAVYFTS